MRSDHTSGHAFPQKGPGPFLVRGAFFALAALAVLTISACDPLTPAGDNSHLEAVTRSLVAENGESAVDGGALPIIAATMTVPATAPVLASVQPPAPNVAAFNNSGLQKELNDEIGVGTNAPPGWATYSPSGYGFGVTGGAVSATYQGPIIATAAADMFDDDPKFEVRINHDADAVSESLIPEIFGPGTTYQLGSYTISGGFLPNLFPFDQCHLNLSPGAGPTGGLW